MTKSRIMLTFLVLAIMGATEICYAQDSEGVECDSTCPEGKKLVSFADGNTASCVCVEEGEGMVETVPSGEFEEGEEIEQVS